jgi:membrane-associated phospholipid phosphatase
MSHCRQSPSQALATALVDNIHDRRLLCRGPTLILIGVVLGIYFLRKRYWRELVMLCNCFGVSAILFRVLSLTFDRTRPAFETPIWHMKVIPGFPSGHAIAVVCSYGLLLYLFVPKIKSRAGKVWLIAGVLSCSSTCSSAGSCGRPFPDGYFRRSRVNLAWSGVSNTTVELLFRKKKQV